MSIMIPKNAQLLFYPMQQCAISAGFKDPKYPTNKNHNFTHFGVDFDNLTTSGFNVISSGVGTVLATEFNSTNSLGGIIVVRYDNVYVSSTKTVKNLIVRYMHLSKVNVKRGNKILPYVNLGTVSGSHKWWNHLHMEIDSDINHPYHTPQVSEQSSALLMRNDANDSTLIDPIQVLVIGDKQTSIIHPNAIYVSNKDTPKYKESDFLVKENLDSSLSPPSVSIQTSQKLILPINNATVTAGYKNTKYHSKFGFRHFGIDMIGQTTIYASGNGTVIACGWDNILGNVTTIKYESVLNHKNGKTIDIIMRYNHLASIRVRSGQKVDKDTVLGVMGNTGKYSAGTHLHIEVDTDAREQHACFTPTLSGNSNIMKAGQDTSFNPAEILYVKSSAPDKQSIKRLLDGYSSDADINMPTIN